MLRTGSDQSLNLEGFHFPDESLRELEIQNEELRNARDSLITILSMEKDRFEYAPVGILFLDEEGRIVELNRRAREQFGVEHQAIVGHTFRSFILPGSYHQFNRAWQAMLDDDEQKPVDVEVAPVEGGGLWLRLEFQFLIGRGNRPSGFMVTTVDISGYMLQQMKLLERERALTEEIHRLKRRIAKVADSNDDRIENLPG